MLNVSAAIRAQPQREPERPGVSGYVLAPDGTPVVSGRVVIQSPVGVGSTTTIEPTGRFRVIPRECRAHRRDAHDCGARI